MLYLIMDLQVYMLVLQANLDDVRRLLRTHPSSGRDDFVMLDELLQSAPQVGMLGRVIAMCADAVKNEIHFCFALLQNILANCFNYSFWS